ncbi:uncharacterized protein LOC122079520 [Macadamia integrifolia]|uniref:uncharacterized protein LOC122079520 n=1 Tax=Macadamia integrifolia TaxID=60698 RepID=UPI001C4E8F97|nr:uncharacterized protein LOC122079520 [Macadamia integrifolia]
MVDTCSLIQVPSQGRKFTWTNNRRRGHVSAVLNRSFCNEAWISYFQECHQFVLQRVASDHAPILVVSEGSERPKNCPFRFQRFWTDHEDYLNAVQSSWENDIPGSPMMVMAQKLKRLKVFLRSWAKENFSNFNLEMMEAKKCMEEIQTVIDRDGISDSIYAKEADAKTKYLKALQNYEKLWAEKSRSRWRDQGDRCSKFFHILVKIRRMKNSIKSLRTVDGTLISEYVAGYYEHFHKEWDRGRLDGIPSDSEIKSAVWDLDPDSAPGPDGFPRAFYKSCWDIISSDVCKAIRWFSRTGYMPYGINNNFLILVSARISVLLNGGPVGYFGVEKGLRQGDPISPMLFIIAEEVLCRGLSELLAKNSIKALSGPRGAIIPTHILFADYVFIFSNASIRLGVSALLGKPLSILEVFWCRPDFSWIKLNVDGCSLGNPGNSGAGGVFRNHRGLVVGSFKKFLGVHTNYYTEFTALMEGILKAKELQVDALWIEMDSVAMVVALQSKSIPWFVLQDWLSVKDYLNSINWKITHCFREANCIADFLAKAVAKSRNSDVNISFPPHIRSEIAHDAESRPRFRFI